MTTSANVAGEDAPGLTPLQRLLISFARKVAIDPQKIAPSDIDELYAAGLGDSEIVEIVAVCCMSAFTNTFTDTLKLADDLHRRGVDVDAQVMILKQVSKQFKDLPANASEDARRRLCLKASWAIRKMALANPLLDFEKLLFVAAVGAGIVSWFAILLRLLRRLDGRLAVGALHGVVRTLGALLLMMTAMIIAQLLIV